MLTDTTDTILSYIKNSVEPIYKIKTTEFSPSSTKILSLLFNRVAYAYEKWKQICNTIRINNISSIDFDTSYYPDEIQKSVQDNIHHFYNCSFKMNDRNISTHIGTPINYNKQKLNSIIRRIYMWLIIADFFAQDKCSQTLNIFLSLIPEKKQLPQIDSDNLDRVHVNTAYTFACKQNNVIHIFRDEEWFKVFIHETFHSFGLDFAEFNHNSTNKQILSIFNVVADVRIFETYCEMWAEICNNMFIIFFSTKWNDNQEKWLDQCMKKLSTMIHNEKIFSIFQSSKILSHFHMKYDDLLSNTHDNLPNPNYKDKTHVLSYYIIKSIFMYNIDLYIRECININGFTINFNKEQSKINNNMKRYCNLVKKLHNDSTFMENMNKLIENVPDSIHNTLRMSVYEMK